MYAVRNLTSNVIHKSKYGFANPFQKKRTPTPMDLAHYDVVIVGSNLGSILSNHLDKAMADKVKIMAVYNDPYRNLNASRVAYEQGLLPKLDTKLVTKMTYPKNIAHSDLQGLESVKPESNEVVLKSGRTIKYDNLVLATGTEKTHTSIKGFDQAWSDPEHDFFANEDHLSWKGDCTKPKRWMFNFKGGEAIYYIPPTPYSGELQNYNFLMAKSYFDRAAKCGQFSWDNSKLTVINANNTFCQHFSKADEFIKSQCEKSNINVEYGLQLVEVNKETNTAIFKTRDGSTVQKPYHSFYSLLPTTPNGIVATSGLADGNGFLDVNRETLQHTKYDNIFGLGSIANAPTTKTFYGGLAQLAVVRNNLQKRLNGHTMNARYDGYSEAPLFLNEGQVSWVSHLYDNVQSSFDTNGFSASLKYSLYSKLGKSNQTKISKGDHLGPPYYKSLKKFDGQWGSKASSELEPNQKNA